jgi:hypothetical protein
MRLVYDKTGLPVKAGDVIHLDGQPHFVHGFREPHKPASSGKVSVKAMNDAGYCREYYVGVIGATWIDRDDRQ